ncbi:hypothetical protein BDN67DRAFT_983523 [Paxillus ammoniavirescens]|nr:hypothetical protein BDN67DRAFT_983523 [Paxillus ammoniavirescens]
MGMEATSATSCPPLFMYVLWAVCPADMITSRWSSSANTSICRYHLHMILNCEIDQTHSNYTLVPNHVNENRPPQTLITQPSAPRPLGSVATQGRNFGSVVTNERAEHPLGSPIQLYETLVPPSSTVALLASPSDTNDPSAITKICREFLISISVSALQAVTSEAPGRHGRAKIQKLTTVKQLQLPLEGMSCKNFLVEALDAHKLTEDYKPEFPFKLGGQKGAATISAFRKAKRVHLFPNYWVVLITFMKPFALMELPDGSVQTKGYRKMSLHQSAWGAAWATQKASLLVPPNCNKFKGAHGGLVTLRPCGRTGPAPQQPSPTATSSPAIDMNLINSLLTAAILPIVSQLSQSRLHLSKHLSSLPPSLASAPKSPLVLNDLITMLEVFCAEMSIDIVDRAQDLAHLDFTSNIIAKLPLDRLAALREGSAFHLQEFAHAWVARKNEKSRIEF